MSIFDMFKTEAPAATPAAQPNATPNATPAQPAQQQVPLNQGNIPAVPAVVTDPNNPAAPVLESTAGAATPATPDTPLAQFQDLWKDVPNDPNEPAAPAQPAELTAESIQKIVENVDFSQQVTPETLAAITAGGEDASAAFTNAMNEVARQVMVQSTLVNNKLTERAVEQAVKSHTENLPAMLRSQAASDHLVTSNPLFSNPAIKPVIEATQAQLLAKFPTATHAEITEMTQKYIIAMGETFTPQKAVNDNSESSATDWEAFLQN